MTPDDARVALLSFTGAEECMHHGHPDFRIGNRIFATLRTEKGTAVLRLPLDLAEAFADERPKICRLASRFGGMGWLEWKLDEVNDDEFQDLAEVAYSLLASRRNG